ncbi:MAG TPA: hypothetical protein VG826_12615 [Pirellulales bacterium]|nr:hypothetical protein [Pirellulales bacterium]
MPGSDCSVLLAYMGLGSGLDLIPYFAALLSLVGAAFVAIVQWPAFVVLRWLRGKRKGTEQEAVTDAAEPPSAPGDQDG